MKKILIGLLLAISAFSYAQDETEWFDAPVSNQIPALGEMLYTYVSGSDTLIRRVLGDYIQPFYFFNDNIYPRKTQNNLVLGTTSNASGHKLLVNGTSYFNAYIWLNSTLFFNHGRIYSSSDNLYFRDNTAGTYSLSDLAQAFPSDDSLRGLIEGYDGLDLNIYKLDFGSSPSVYNGDDDPEELIFDFGASPSENMVIRPGLMGSSFGYAIDYGGQAENLRIGTYATESGFSPIWTFNQSYAFSETDTLARLRDLRELDLSNSGPGGTYDATVANNDTVWFAGYDTATNTFAYFPSVKDTISIEGSVMINITNANILNGDSLPVLPAPGPGKLNYVTDVVMFYDHGGTSYTVSANTHIYSRRDASNNFAIATNATAFLFSADYIATKAGSSSTHGWIWNNPGDPYIGLNQPVWLQLGNHDTGNGTAKLIVYYKQIDFN